MPAIGTLLDAERRRDVAVDFARRRAPSGSMLAGMPNSRSSSSSHCSVWMLNSIVREALLTSVTWRAPPVSFQTSQVSTVPNASLPASARARAPGTLSRIQRILLRGEVGVDEQAGLRLDRLAGAVGFEPLAEVRGAAILPDDRVVDRLAGLAVPDDGRFALVGDADGGDVLRPQPARVRALRRRRRSATPRSPAGRARPSRPAERSA